MLDLVVYFEGLPGSGKTTLVNQIANDYSELFQLVPEYIDPQKAHEASKHGDQAYFLKNDEEKYLRAKSNAASVLVDRGHLSTILYSKAYELLKGRPLVDVDTWYFDKILAEGMLPDLYVHINTTPKTTFARRPKVTTWDNVWDYEEALRFADSEFAKYVQTYEHVPILELDGETMTTDEMEKAFMQHIRSLTNPIKNSTGKEAVS